MRIGRSILLLLSACLTVCSTPVTVRADSTATQEYRLKAAFLYNFILFVDSERLDAPQKNAKNNDPNRPILVGILGKDPFGDAFDPLENREVRNRRVAIQRFKGLGEYADEEGRLPNRHPHFERIEDCHVLFVCPSEKQHIVRILRSLGRQSLLTVGDTPGFLEAGGVINFLIEDKKIGFEINTMAAQRARLQIRSQLLRLAKRIVKTDAFQGHNDGGNDAGK
ncbi:YfiR family protein [Anaerobaca lacustris]|uniref:YfiR family protein n=1 Tax=Anaerobaca lacustris TaxID=3044600 RepID=A0AAW6TY96_9BACT|nr:YfiR family protein [Sedimentisphaerales bacterium M17dextr]